MTPEQRATIAALGLAVEPVHQALQAERAQHPTSSNASAIMRDWSPREEALWSLLTELERRLADAEAWLEELSGDLVDRTA